MQVSTSARGRRAEGHLTAGVDAGQIERGYQAQAIIPAEALAGS